MSRSDVNKLFPRLLIEYRAVTDPAKHFQEECESKFPFFLMPFFVFTRSEQNFGI